MAVDKYSRDYRIVETVDEKGRIRSEAEYIGAAYGFAAEGETARRALRRSALFCLLGWLGFLGPLLFQSTAMRTLVAALPFAFSALPLWLLSGAVFSGLRAKEPFDRRTADRLTSRFPAAAVFTAALPGVSLIARLVSALVRHVSFLPGDGAFAVGALLLCAAGLLCFRQRRAVAAKEL